MKNSISGTSLAASWAAVTALCGIFGFIALRWYAFLAASCFVGLIAWDMLTLKRSRRLLLAGAALSGLAGLLCRAFFWTPEGMDFTGFIVLVPYGVLVIAIAVGVFFMESRSG